MGNQAKIYFYPLKGFTYFINKSYEDNRDSLQFLRLEKRKNSNLQFILSNTLFTPYILFCDDKSIREFNQISANTTEKARLSIGFQTLLKDGLLMSYFEQWKTQRNHLSTYFNFEYLKNVVPMIEQLSQEKVQEVEKELKSQQEKEETKPLNLISHMTIFAFKVVTRFLFTDKIEQDVDDTQLFFGEKMHLASKLSSKYVQQSVFYKLKVLLFKDNAYKYFVTNGEKQVLNVYGQIRAQLTKIIENRKKEIQNTATNNNLFDELIHLHIKKPDEMPINQILSQYLGMLAGGQDTTGYGVSLLLYFLSKNEDSQNKLREEIQKYFVEDKISYEQLQKMNYLNCAIKESFRHFSRAPLTLIREIKKDTQVLGITIQKNHYASDLLYLADQFLYEDDYMEFKPERWMESNIKPNNPLTFSSGPRNCIGQHLSTLEIKIIICYLLKNFQLLPVQNYSYQCRTTTLNDIIDHKMVIFQKIKQ